MAQRRMFSKSITNSSQFLMMPSSSQNLYFHLGMNADDDGFCEHFALMRMTDSKPDDLKILQAKGFVHVFDDKVLVIIDWKENNYLRNDRYSASKYLVTYKKELKLLAKNPVGLDTDGIPNGNPGKVRLGKVSIDNNSETSSHVSPKKKYSQEGAEVLKAFEGIDAKNKTYYGNKTQREACDFLIETYGKEQVLELVPRLAETNKKSVYQITTPWEMKEKITKVFNDLTRVGESIKGKKTKYYG